MPGKHKVQGFPLHTGQSSAQRQLRTAPGCVWAGQAEGTAPAVNLHPRGHTCPICARQNAAGMHTGLGGLCISIPSPPAASQDAPRASPYKGIALSFSSQLFWLSPRVYSFPRCFYHKKERVKEDRAMCRNWEY